MPHLIKADYYSTIEGSNLEQIISENDDHRIIKEKAALTEIKSYLVQKYNTDNLFRDTVKFSYTTPYRAGQLVYLDADAFSASSAYSQYALVRYSGNIYYAKTTLVAGAWNASNFQLLGEQYQLFYIPSPYQDFSKTTFYSRGEYVYYNNKVYKSLRDSTILSHESTIQFNDYRTMPAINDLPDTQGTTQWSAGVSYVFSSMFPIAVYTDFDEWDEEESYIAGQRVQYSGIIYQAFASSTGTAPGTDHTKWLPVSWESGDNRNAQLVEALVQITLYKLSTRISPRHVPDVWVKNYDDKISWLKMCAKGEVTLDAPLLQNKVTGRIRWGSSPERNNSY